jgi:hypothetical protein
MSNDRPEIHKCSKHGPWYWKDVNGIPVKEFLKKQYDYPEGTPIIDRLEREIDNIKNKKVTNPREPGLTELLYGDKG